MSANDTELARSAAGGDLGAFHALVELHSGGMMRLAMWLCRNRADAEDAVQESLVAAFRGIRGFDGRSTFKTWVTRILIRQAGRIREKSRRHRGFAEGQNGVPGRETEPTVQSPASQVDQRIDLAAGIESLPEDQRHVVLLREIQGMSYDEIAEALGIPIGTVESRLHRGRLALRQRLQDYVRKS